MATPGDLTITIEQTSNGGRFVARTSEGPESELTFSFGTYGALLMDHTGVPRELEGRGIAAALVKHAVEYARAQGLRLKPDCSYVVAAFARHPEWSDVLSV